MKVEYNLIGHTQVVNKVVVSPDGALCASAGKDGLVIMWDLSTGLESYRVALDESVVDVAFSPASFLLAIATTKEVKIYDLETKQFVATGLVDFPAHSVKALTPACTCVCWSNDGASLFVGYTDNVVRMWDVKSM
jgi:guanine nucleotide-binding protein subunit beta-2-like 1 protein